MSASCPTILIVDDHSDLRDALTVLLEHEGYRVADVDTRRTTIAARRSSTHPIPQL